MRNDRPEHHEEHHDISHHSNGRRTPDRTGPVARGARGHAPVPGPGATRLLLAPACTPACIAGCSIVRVPPCRSGHAAEARPPRPSHAPAGAVTPDPRTRRGPPGPRRWRAPCRGDPANARLARMVRSAHEDRVSLVFDLDHTAHQYTHTPSSRQPLRVREPGSWVRSRLPLPR
jgi:hypothetical protein